jgi:putative MATE family efflux protein
MFFVFSIGLTDVYVAGKFGKEVQAAYGLVSQLYFVFSIIAAALTVGSVSVISRLSASGDTQALGRAVDSSVTASAVAGVIFGIAGFVFSDSIIFILRVPDAIKGIAVSLMRIYSLGLWSNYLLFSTNGVLRAAGMIKKSLWTMALVSVVNVVFNFLLSFKTPLGFKGIGVATVFSTTVGMLFNLAYARKLMSGRLSFSFQMIKKIAHIGWPAGLLQILWQFGLTVLFLILSALPRYNIETLAAFTNGLKIESAIFLPAFAFNMACAVVVGNLLGKKEKADAFSAGIITALGGVAIVSVLTIIVLCNARTIAMCLSNNEVVIKECVRYIYISLLGEPLMAWGVILSGGLNGAGDTKGVLIAVASSVWLVRVPLSYLFGVHYGFGAPAVWWSMNLSILIQTLLISRRYFRKKWLIAHD